MRPPGRSTRRNSDRPRTGSGKNISPRLHRTASKLSSENESACPSSTETETFGASAETLARLRDHGRRDVGGGDVAGRADRGEGRFGGEPGACRDVKDAHARRNPAARNKKGMKYAVTCANAWSYSCRRLILEGEFLRHPRLPFLVLVLEGMFSNTRWLEARPQLPCTEV